MHMWAGRVTIRGIGKIANMVANFHRRPLRRRRVAIHMAIAHLAAVAFGYPNPPAQPGCRIVRVFPTGARNSACRERINIARIWWWRDGGPFTFSLYVTW